LSNAAEIDDRVSQELIRVMEDLGAHPAATSKPA
jgi:hypothetical protein